MISPGLLTTSLKELVATQVYLPAVSLVTFLRTSFWLWFESTSVSGTGSPSLTQEMVNTELPEVMQFKEVNVSSCRRGSVSVYDDRIRSRSVFRGVADVEGAAMLHDLPSAVGLPRDKERLACLMGQDQLHPSEPPAVSEGLWGDLWGETDRLTFFDGVRGFQQDGDVLTVNWQLTQSQGGHEIGVTLDPPEPVAGKNITLIPGGYVEDIGICFWLRGRGDEKHRILTYFPPPLFIQEDGPAYTGRETIGEDCSMHIRELKAADTGNYTILKNKLRASENTGNPEAKKVDGVPSGFIAGTAAGSFLGLMLTGSLVYYRLFSTSSL
ncbi:hypothetical protein JD844_006113 [Phrynosoma platyrhinos]|uniref:Uncharacterized protein n=1 Tax=Phrynosoma platyrhinos TaxID=52577 RepID=A0ABQ7TQ94_PHRPL|nr:hypothetical protein JD844_006113 [Phrynosoma platyrhinos]